ncbi:Uncharacterised protein [Mycobacteroides abscessus subsp. abscessus]|nr:Uncharacterised protein [Mycobacteroides abscessus subsp. abscessus]
MNLLVPAAIGVGRVLRATERARRSAVGSPENASGGTESTRTPPGLGASPIDEMLRDLLQEARFRIRDGLSPRCAGHRTGQVEPFLGAGDTDVGESALLAQLGRVAEGTHMREMAVLPAGDEHDRKLETLRGVQGHQCDDAIALVGHLIGVGDKRDLLEEGGQ